MDPLDRSFGPKWRVRSRRDFEAIHAAKVRREAGPLLGPAGAGRSGARLLETPWTVSLLAGAADKRCGADQPHSTELCQLAKAGSPSESGRSTPWRAPRSGSERVPPPHQKAQ